MKTTDEWIDRYINLQWSFKKLIEEVQKEAWNESILLSAESATIRFIPFSDNTEIDRESILKNLIP